MKSSKSFLAIAVAVLTSVPAIAQRTGENGGGDASLKAQPPAPSERLNFHTDLFTGRFGYQVPFDLAPGRHGYTPDIGLSYNSSSDSSWCGVGWDLDFGYIQRQTKHGVPVAWATTGLPLKSYDDSKGFSFLLNGHAADLVSLGNNQYRAEIESGFLNFQFQTNLNQWLVTDKSGNQYFFGTNSAARMSNPKTGWSSNAWSGSFRWSLSHVQTVLGDTVDYSYTNIGGTLYPIRAAYNGFAGSITNTHTVDFILGNRSDVKLSFISGYHVEQSKRLDAIVHKVSGQVVWSNRLNYAQSASTQRTLLSSVTRYGTNLTSTLPPISFGYSVQAFGFQPLTTWTNISIPTGGYPNYYQVSYTSGALTELDLLDMDGDGLPDRVFQQVYPPYTNLFVQHNNGSGFDNPVQFTLANQTFFDGVQTFTTTNADWTAVNGAYMRFIDINNDGVPDRVMDPIASMSGNITPRYPYTNLLVQFNVGTNLDGTGNWTNILGTLTNASGNEVSYRSVENGLTLLMLDMNGDGLPDRVMTKARTPYDGYYVQLNTGSGFTQTNLWSFDSYDDPAQPGYYGNTVNIAYLRLIDLNGDGLPDRVFFPTNATGTADGTCGLDWMVQFNNGYGFEPTTHWTGIAGQYTQGAPCSVQVFCPENDPDSGLVSLLDCNEHVLRDINGDGLPDFIYRYRDCSITNLMVQINLGTNFATAVPYGPYYSQGDVNDLSGLQGGTNTHFVDIDGDGIPDHVMYGYPLGSQSYYGVELSKGPLSDLLNLVSNGIGGTVNVTYKPSTKYDNGLVAGNGSSRKLLPYIMQTVASVSESDGIYPSNITSYSYSGGIWSAARREFHGFAQVTETDPLGATNIHWFHQAGGRDNSAYGEYQDATNNIGKNGIEFRQDTIGSDGQLYKSVLNLVQDAALGSGRHFGFSSQTLDLDYPGNGGSYRARAKQFGYDLGNGNLTNTINFGEVTNVVVSGQGFTDTPGNDSVYQMTTFASLANTNILDKPQRTILTGDSAGQNVLRETLYSYAGNTGNLTQRLQRMCDQPCYVTNSFGYDSYNNRNSATDEAGVNTVTTYDSQYQAFPASQTVAGSFTSTFSYDARSGKLATGTDAKGLVTANLFDPFLRLVEVDTSTTPNGVASTWLSRYDYRLGLGSGFSTNILHIRKNDDTDANNGHETWEYFDGLGRTLQTREESETNNSFRVTDNVYDKRGQLLFQTLPYFSTGTNFTKPSGTELGTLRAYDQIGRGTNLTAGVNGTFSSGLLTGTTVTGGDTGSPLGSAGIDYNDSNDPWTLVVNDEAGKIHKFSLDAYGRTNKVAELNGGVNQTTVLAYNLAGDLTNITDNAQNQIQYAYNELGQLAAMADPDMGVWFYERDYAGRLHQQIDGNGQKVVFNYIDSLGRLSDREAYDFQGKLAYGITNTYDGSGGDSAYTVYKGQLFMTGDSEGWQKNSYDVRSRTLKTVRYLVKNGNTYTNQYAYDDEDRTTEITYPNGGPTITNIFDTGGNLSQVAQIGGSNTVFYAARGFNALGQLNGINFGNGVVTTNNYFSASKRLQQVVTFKAGSTNIQNLSYTYDKVSNLGSIVDGVYSSTSSAALTSLVYDDLHRLTSLTRPAISQTTTFTYDSLGNILTSGENGGGTYNYGTRIPHAVKSANGINYAYDGCGNMLVRGTQRLSYDPENRLSYVVTTNGYTQFGYDAGGARLWKQSSTNTLQVWIDGNYEEKNGKTLFHVSAGDRLVCTFDATGTNVFSYYHPDHLHSTAIETDTSGNRIQHYEYSAYGQDRFIESSSAFPVSRRYTSQVRDDETGLYYYGARYYDPQLGRFIQPDTVVPSVFSPQNFNRYSYTLNNPLKYVDRQGHQAVEPDPEPRGVITEEIIESLRVQRETPAQTAARHQAEFEFQFAPRSTAPSRPASESGATELWSGTSGGVAARQESAGGSPTQLHLPFEMKEGSVDYGSLDALGRPTGVRATITPEMIGTGTKADSSIRPPGFEGEPAGHARGHLLGRQLGGSGDEPENLVTLMQRPANTPVMRGFENQIRSAVAGGQTVNFTATPVYQGVNAIPRGITLSAQGSGGYKLDVSILNQ